MNNNLISTEKVSNLFPRFMCKVIPLAFDESMSYYECLCALLHKVNETINSLNTNNEAINELQNKYIELKNYVDNYFTNLDVQEEINNKLDSMVEDGTINNILLNYSQITKIYETLNDVLMDENLTNGMNIKTLGYYNINDGGGATYKITNNKPNTYYEKSNNLYLELIIENNTINILQLGATLTNDIKPYIEKYLEFNITNKIKLYIPSGTWKCSDITIDKWFYIYGDSEFTYNTIISPLNETPDHIFKLYNSNEFVANWTLQNISFRSTPIINNCLEINHFQYGTLKNVSFQNVNGGAISLKNCWEITFTDLVFRHVIPITKGINKGIINFDDTSLGSISTLYFNYIQLENNIGNVFVINTGCGVYNNHIGTINIEQPNPSTPRFDELVPTIEILPYDSTKVINDNFALLKSLDNTEVGCLTINTIDTNNMASCIYYYLGNNYIFDTLFDKAGQEQTNKTLGIQITDINFLGLKKDVCILNAQNGLPNIVNYNNFLNINSVLYSHTNGKKAYINCFSENNIKVPSLKNTQNSYNNQLKPIYEIANIIGSNNFGMIKSDEKSINNAGLVFYPSLTRNEGGIFKIIATGKTLIIRYHCKAKTFLQVQDLTANVIKNTDVLPSDDYQWFELDLTTIEGFQIGDELQVGSSAGYNLSMDVYAIH